ncbi:MAG: DUF1080 domain-containing protein [Bryobacteraceae bacterium]|nr:DUF1080 domain-containing protein [Bryobacteraceae bacterium]
MYRYFATLVLAALAAPASDGFVSLMPRKDVTELWTIEGTPAAAWRVENGRIFCAGTPNGFLRSRKVYRNYVLRAEWKFKKEGWVAKPEDEGWPNAGFFIHAGKTVDGWPTSLEVQGHFGEAGSVFGVRGANIKGAKRGPIVKDRIPFGEWDRYEITSKDGKITVILNGKLVNEGYDASPSQGNICLQSEGWEVHYRNVEIKELP